MHLSSSQRNRACCFCSLNDEGDQTEEVAAAVVVLLLPLSALATLSRPWMKVVNEAVSLWVVFIRSAVCSGQLEKHGRTMKVSVFRRWHCDRDSGKERGKGLNIDG